MTCHMKSASFSATNQLVALFDGGPTKITQVFHDRQPAFFTNSFLRAAMFFTSTALCFNSAKDSPPSATFLSSSVTCLVSSPLKHLNFDATILGCCTAPERKFLDCETLLVWSFISKFSNFWKTRSNSEKAGSSNPLRRYMNSRDSYNYYTLLLYFCLDSLHSEQSIDVMIS